MKTLDLISILKSTFKHTVRGWHTIKVWCILQNQQKGELISTQNMQHKYNNTSTRWELLWAAQVFVAVLVLRILCAN